MKKVIYFLTFIAFFSSCTKDEDPIVYEKPEVSIENISGLVSIMEGETIQLKIKVKSGSESNFSWYVDGEMKNDKDSLFKFSSSEIGIHTVSLLCTNIGGRTEASLEIEVYGKYRHGTYILNEGNMSSGNGSLIFINPEGEVTDSAYFKKNKTQLGNACQDLFINNNKIYIISQNGKKSKIDNDGRLIVANAETLEKEVAYNDEISELNWPTNIAVLNEENIFIRDNKGIYLFNSKTKGLKFIEGSEGAKKNRMAVVNNKVFAASKENILILEAGKTEVSSKVEIKDNISGILKSADGNIWISTTGTSHKITKIKSTDYSVIKENTLTEGSVSAGWGASPGICAKGDTLYFSGASTKIYRHVFNTGETKFMVDAKDMVENSNMLYNNIGVHPISGEVYMTTIKGYGQNYLTNNISVFNFNKTEPQLSHNYKNLTHFPAGVFFTYDF